MFRNMVTSLMLHGQIKTTTEKAKELRRVADRVISLGKRAPSTDGLTGEELASATARRVHAIRRAALWLNNDEAMAKVFGEYAARFAERPGGYTRVVKAGFRGGDNAAMSIISVTTDAVATPVADVVDEEVAEAEEDVSEVAEAGDDADAADSE